MVGLDILSVLGRRWPKRGRWLCCALLVALTAAMLPAAVRADKTGDLHRRAWNECLDSADAIPAARFGFYAYRSLAVPDLNVYLVADSLFSDVIENLPGSRLAYRMRDVRDLEFFQKVARRENRGGEFSWTMWSVFPDSIYDSRESWRRRWPDRRLASAAVLLRANGGRLTTLEAAVLRFTAVRRLPQTPKSLYVVIDVDGAGYLAADSALWLAGMPNRAVVAWSDVRPVAVFNEHSVYYPLLGRDDRNADTALNWLVARLGTVAKPDLDDADAQALSRAAATLRLSDDASRRLAMLVASGLVDISQPPVRQAWAEYTGSSDSARQVCAILQLREAFFWANRLSPHVAALASLLQSDSLEFALKRTEDYFFEKVGRIVYSDDSSKSRAEAWGILWSQGLLETIFDDNARTRAGSSFSQSCAMSAALDLAGIEHLQLAPRIGGKVVPDQEWLLVSDGRYQFNLGKWTLIPSDMTARRNTLGLRGLSVRGRPVVMESGNFCGCVDPLEIADRLTRIARALPMVEVQVMAPSGQIVSALRMAVELTEGTQHPYAPEWPMNTGTPK